MEKRVGPRVKKWCEMNFAKSQLKKHGWKEGSGLGKHEEGIKEAIKVKIKNDCTGVGHDPGAEFTFHWWDHVFNKAASSIQVQTTQDGVSLKKSTEAGPMKKTKTKTFDNKSMLYGKFIKAATLSNGSYEAIPKSHDHFSDEEESTPTNTAVIPANEEEIFKKCGGRTAHKAARHGNKLNGKLFRIQEQEKKLLENMNQTTSSTTTNQMSSHPLPQDSSHVKCSEHFSKAVVSTQKSKKSKKQKKKRKKETEDIVDCDDESGEIQGFKNTDVVEVKGLEQDRDKKSSKRKRTLDISNEDIQDLLQEKQQKKKKKKRSKSETE